MKNDNYKKVYSYLKRKSIYKRKWKSRPFEMSYGIIALATDLTYKQVRLIIKKMIEKGELEKWNKYPSIFHTQSFYRLTEFKTITKK